MIFGPKFQSALREGKTKFLIYFLIGVSATKSFARSRIFRYGLPKDILSKGQRTKEGWLCTATPLPLVKGLKGVSHENQIDRMKRCKWFTRNR